MRFNVIDPDDNILGSVELAALDDDDEILDALDDLDVLPGETDVELQRVLMDDGGTAIDVISDGDDESGEIILSLEPEREGDDDADDDDADDDDSESEDDDDGDDDDADDD